MSITFFGAASVDATSFVGTLKVVTNFLLKAAPAVLVFLVEAMLFLHIVEKILLVCEVVVHKENAILSRLLYRSTQ